MIDQEQRILWRLCKVPPDKYWDYSPGETALMIQESLKEFETEQDKETVRHAELLTAILNTPHQAPKDGKYLHEVSDFIPERLRKKITPKRTIAELNAAWEQYSRGFQRR